MYLAVLSSKWIPTSLYIYISRGAFKVWSQNDVDDEKKKKK